MQFMAFDVQGKKICRRRVIAVSGAGQSKALKGYSDKRFKEKSGDAGWGNCGFGF
jgi:hypothetical protein